MPATMEVIRPGEIDQWDQALYGFLAEKERRSGSAEGHAGAQAISQAADQEEPAGGATGR